jgi:hypothetical protein
MQKYYLLKYFRLNSAKKLSTTKYRADLKKITKPYEAHILTLANQTGKIIGIKILLDSPFKLTLCGSLLPCVLRDG